MAGAVVGGILTILGTPFINTAFERTKVPGIAKEVSRTKIDTLPSSVQDQITLVTTRYSLKHMSGGTGKGVTIILTAGQQIPKTNIVVDKTSEAFDITTADEKSYKINIPVIRQKAGFVVEVTHQPKNTLTWDERAEEGKIVDTQGPTDQRAWDLVTNAWTIFIVLSSIGALLIFLLVKYFVNVLLITDTSTGRELTSAEKKRFASVIFSIWAFSNLTKGLTGAGVAVSLSEAFFGFALYFAITNTNVLMKCISAIVESQETR